jgi:hypothetical protein
MSKNKSARDHRRSFRCTVADAHQTCQLKVGSRVLSATLQDESAGGFSVLVDRPTGLKVNQTAELQTSAGRFEVSVVHVIQVLPPDDIPPAVLAKRGPWFRLGLRRMSETGLPQPPRISLFAESLYVHLGQWCPSGGILAVIGLLLAMAVVSVPLTLMGTNWHAGRGTPLNFNLGTWGGNVASPTATESGRAAEFQQALKSAVGRTPDVALLVKPHAVRELQLSVGQQDQLRQLIEATSQALRDLDAQLQGQKRHEVSDLRTQVVDEAYRTALKLLTDQQRAQWEKMTAKQ